MLLQKYYEFKVKLKAIFGIKPKSTKTYWEDRYKKGRTSGSGSYGRLANFKSETLNQLFNKYNIETVLELGCGDGNQLKQFHLSQYIGYDISNLVVEENNKAYQNNNSISFTNDLTTIKDKVDCTLSLDVIYHLLEFETYSEYLESLFKYSNKYVIIYSSNYESKQMGHVKHHKFTDFVISNLPNWELVESIKNKYPYDKSDPDNTSWADFFIYEKKH